MIDFSGIEIRTYFLLAALLVSGWLVFLLLRLIRTMRQTRYARQQADEKTVESVMENKLDNAVATPATSSAPLDFASQLARSSMERALQVEVEHLRQEMQQLRAEVAHLATELRQLKMIHNVSPVYAEAVTLAQQGVSTVDIADRCGISLGEAELVAALAKSEARGGFDEKR